MKRNKKILYGKFKRKVSQYTGNRKNPTKGKRESKKVLKQEKIVVEMEKDLIIGKRIEYKNAKKDTIQTGVVVDKIMYREKPSDEQMATGYLVTEDETKTARVIKPVRIIKIHDFEEKKCGGNCGGCKEGKEKKTVKVFSQPECVFNYCLHEAECKNGGCLSQRK